MTADTIEELHAMASKIGLKRSWFQPKKRFPHYDVSESKRLMAIRHGAIAETAIEGAKRRRRNDRKTNQKDA
jgi:hypothetical protein